MTAQGSSSRSVVGSGQFTYTIDPMWAAIPVSWSAPDVSAVAVDHEDNVHLLSPDEDVLRTYTQHGQLVRELNLTDMCRQRGEEDPEQGPSQKRTYRHSVTIGPGDTFYCADIRENSVRWFSMTGELLSTLGAPGVGSDTGTSTEFDFRSIERSGGPFNGPTKLAIAPTGDLYVSDGYRNARIHCFSPEGELKFSWGAPGRERIQFRVPHSIAVTPKNEILVADRENNRLVFFDLAGRFLSEWTDVIRPTDIAIDENGFIYVTELGLYATSWSFLPPDDSSKPSSRCTIFSPQGEVVARWGSRDSKIPGSVYAPHCVAVDSHGDIYVGETNRGFRPNTLGHGPWEFRTLHKFVRTSTEG